MQRTLHVRPGDGSGFQPHWLVTGRALEEGRVGNVKVRYQLLAFLYEASS
jgi:hypothetical protein